MGMWIDLHLVTRAFLLRVAAFDTGKVRTAVPRLPLAVTIDVGRSVDIVAPLSKAPVTPVGCRNTVRWELVVVVVDDDGEGVGRTDVFLNCVPPIMPKPPLDLETGLAATIG